MFEGGEPHGIAVLKDSMYFQVPLTMMHVMTAINRCGSSLDPVCYCSRRQPASLKREKRRETRGADGELVPRNVGCPSRVCKA